MDSEEDVFALIERVYQWSNQELQNNIDNVVQTLTMTLTSCQDQSLLVLKCIEGLLMKCLPYLPLSSLESLVLQPTLPLTKKLFLQALDGVHTNLQSKDVGDLPEVLSGLLQICIELLSFIDHVLQYIPSLGQVPVETVPSIPGCVVTVLLEAFRHCKDSESEYGDMFQAVSGTLTTLFVKTRDVQVHYLAVIHTTLHFNCTYEDELSLLTEVMDQLAVIGEIVSGLETKCLAEQWKGYSRLAEQYAYHLKPRLDILRPIRFLAGDIQENLQKNILTVDNIDGKQLIKVLKVSNFMLKVLIKLCELYSDYLGECHSHLLSLLVTLFRVSPIGLQLYSNAENEIIQEIERYVSVAAEPLISLLITDNVFVETFFKCSDPSSTDEEANVAKLLLSLNILKKLIKSEKSIRKMWLNSSFSDHILSIIFKLVDYCHCALSCSLKIPSGLVQASSRRDVTDFYELILIHLGGFIMSVYEDEFHIVEEVMLENVFQANYWRALLAVDLWCIIGRYGSAELCYHHVKYLLSLMKPLVHCYVRPEVTFLKSLIIRLISFLPVEYQTNIMEQYPFSENLSLWLVLGKSVPKPSNGSFIIRCNIQKFQSGSTDSYVFKNVIDSLACIPLLCETDAVDDTLITSVISLWGYVDISSNVSWMQHFIVMLAEATSALLSNLNASQLCKVFGRLKDVPKKSEFSVKLSVLTILKSLATKTIEASKEQVQVFNYVTQLFSALLSDNINIVKQRALETFSYFAHLTRHEQIVVNVAGSGDVLRVVITTYLSGVLPSNPKRSEMEYHRQLSKFHYSHRCYKEPEPISFEPPLKRNKTDIPENILEVVSSLKQSLSVIVKHTQEYGLSADLKEELDIVSKQVSSLIE